MRALLSYGMIRRDETILIGVSGGKDSLTLARLLSRISKGFPVPFRVTAIHAKSEFSPSAATDQVAALMEEWEIPFSIIPLPMLPSAEKSGTITCYQCSTQRRSLLLAQAQKRGIETVALGHHREDILETFLMNLFFKGEISTMLPNFFYDKFQMRIIRPLALIPEKEIIRYSNQYEWERFTCVCGLDVNSKRRSVRKLLDRLVEEEGESVLRSFYRALHNPRMDYLPRVETVKDFDALILNAVNGKTT